MGMLDDAKDKMSDGMDSMRARYEELKSREQDGSLDDKGRMELDQLRNRFERKD